MEKQEVNFRIRKERPPPEIPEGDECMIRRPAYFRGDELLPKTKCDGFDEGGPLLKKDLSVFGCGKLLLKPCGFGTI
jgi:hypothetical protein